MIGDYRNKPPPFSTFHRILFAQQNQWVIPIRLRDCALIRRKYSYGAFLWSKNERTIIFSSGPSSAIRRIIYLVMHHYWLRTGFFV